MKRLFIPISLFILLCSIFIVFATTKKENLTVVLQSPSQDCPYGQRILYEDRNGDGEYDWETKQFCDGKVTTGPMFVVGDDNLGVGVKPRITHGTFGSGNCVIEYYYDSDPTIVVNYYVENGSNGIPTLYGPEFYP